MKTILHLFRIERPVLFYGGFGLFLAVIALTISVPLVITFARPAWCRASPPPSSPPA
jgi:hypothetical protein